jgi:hypothetical protein
MINPNDFINASPKQEEPKEELNTVVVKIESVAVPDSDTGPTKVTRLETASCPVPDSKTEV